MTTWQRTQILLRPLLILYGGFLLYIVASGIFLYVTGYATEKREIQTFNQTILKSLRYESGQWDTRAYNANPHTPHPTGSSGFSFPLYIITTDGFVIERSNPVNGLLDSTDFSRLRSLTTPQTITTVTNENWRVLSVPIQEEGKPIGVVFVAFYRPIPTLISDIDERLAINATRIASSIKTDNGEMNVANVDISTVDYDMSFEIVDSFNHILANNGRTPSFIDVSYVAAALRSPSVIVVRDPITDEPYLMSTSKYRDADGKPVAVIVTGHSVLYLQSMIVRFFIFSLLGGIGVILIAAWGLARSGWYEWATHSLDPTLPAAWPKHLVFQKKDSILEIDEEQIQIPFATNQYYLLEAVFSSPRKRWELDEILEKFGVESSKDQWRKVYDAMMLLNKKMAPLLPEKLIVHQDKTYRLNPAYLPIVLPPKQQQEKEKVHSSP